MFLRILSPITITNLILCFDNLKFCHPLQLFTVDAHYTTLTVVVCCREDGDQDGEVGELEGSNNSSGLLSHSTMGTGKLESPLPPQSSLDLDKQGKTCI